MLFWLLATTMMLIALGLVITPLWRDHRRGTEPSSEAISVSLFRQRQTELKRELEAGLLNEQAYRQALTQLEQQLLQDTAYPAQHKDTEDMQAKPGKQRYTRYWPIMIVAIALPLAAVSLYMEIGNENGNRATAGQQPPASVEEMVAGLEARLKNTPDDGDGWLMLGRSYSVLGQPKKAVSALSQARRILGDTPPVLLEYAQALASRREPPSFSGRPAKLVKQALNQAPNDPQALWLSGVVAAERGGYSEAEKHWQKLLTLQTPNSQDAKIIQQNLDAIRKEIGASTGDTKNPEPSTGKAAAASLVVTVKLAPELADRVQPQDPVFIFARATQGSPMPLAVARHQVSELPLTITLDSSDSMTPGHSIANQAQVQVVARVAKSGDVRATAGDLQTTPQSIRVNGRTQVSLVIDTVVK